MPGVQRQEAFTSASPALSHHTRTSVCGSKSFLDFWRFERNLSVIILRQVSSISGEVVKATRWHRLHITLADNSKSKLFVKLGFHFETIEKKIFFQVQICMCMCYDDWLGWGVAIRWRDQESSYQYGSSPPASVTPWSSILCANQCHIQNMKMTSKHLKGRFEEACPLGLGDRKNLRVNSCVCPPTSSYTFPPLLPHSRKPSLWNDCSGDDEDTVEQIVSISDEGEWQI